MRYLSVCSGIEAASVAWKPLGWQPVAFSEIEAAPSRVLAHHYPDVPNLGDMNGFRSWPNYEIDVLVGGTPCQSFSVAGLRAGLADPRGNLALVYLAVADKYRPRWLVWENVPGVLSSSGGRDFGAFLGALVKLGYGFAYRVLDAQYFGVPQRRRRVILVGYLGDWRRAAAVLFERESLLGYLAPGRSARENIADAPEDRIGTVCQDVAPTLTACCADKWGLENQHIDSGAGLFVVHGTQDPCVSDKAFALGRNSGRENAVFAIQGAASGGSSRSYIAHRGVRRLTPRECERLQGFPDDYTLVPWRRGMMADGPRYKALGNSMAVPVMRWIGERIELTSAVFD